ncbi:hypothetical protein [Gorillibacterium sp. sgz5001074]
MTERELYELMESMKEHHEWQLEQWRKEREQEIYEMWEDKP